MQAAAYNGACTIARSWKLKNLKFWNAISYRILPHCAFLGQKFLRWLYLRIWSRHKKGDARKKISEANKKKKITAVCSSLRWTNRLGRSEYKKVPKKFKIDKVSVEIIFFLSQKANNDFTNFLFPFVEPAWPILNLFKYIKSI